ncbi:MAG TPA: hypothetical protein VN604_11285 [Nitrospirota bacterium]|nr:hypothetical protein [Nitrospirota bacterium]
MVRGPQNTIYIQIDRKIAKVSADGDVLHVLDLGRDAVIPERIADFFVEDDGRLMIARRDSQLLQYYSPDGELIKTHSRVPSELVNGDHFCKFSKDSATGILYFADTSHHRIQIYGPDEKEIKTILQFSGSSVITVPEEDPEGVSVTFPDTPLHYPNGLLFDGDRLLVADTGNYRIVIFHPDGSLDRIIPVRQTEASSLVHPLRVSRYGNIMYAILRGPNFLGGRVASFDLMSGQEKYFRQRGPADPWDVLSRPDDVLIADRGSLSVVRYTHDGKFLSTFGRPSLQGLYADRQVVRKAYQWLRIASLAGMLIVLGWLLFASRRQRIAQDQAGESPYAPVPGLQKILGPMGSVRRKVLLFLIPGLGQAAAGRILRAVTLSVVLLIFISLIAYSWFQFSLRDLTSLPVLVIIVLMVYTVWIAIVLDGVRLSGKPSDVFRRLSFKRVFAAVAVPLITVGSAAAIQLVREAIVRSNPEISLSIQTVIRSFMSVFHTDVSPFSAMLPAVVIFGWGGAAAGMFGALAWQAQAGRSKILIGIFSGFLAGITSWGCTVLLVGNRPGALLYMPPVQGVLLGSLAYFSFRSKGMPLLVVPAAAAGAWTGDFLKMFLGIGDTLLMKVLAVHGVDSVWIGAITRVELIVCAAYFIHLAIWAAWNTAAARPVGSSGEMDS